MQTSICVGREDDGDEVIFLHALGSRGGDTTAVGQLCTRRRLRNLQARLLRLGKSLLFLRTLNLLLAVWLLADFRRIFVVVEEWQRYATALSNNAAKRSGRGDNSQEPLLDWGQIDIDEPPALDDPFLEALRFTELLVNDAEAAARGHGRCVRRISVGGASDAFFVCADERYLLAAAEATYSVDNRTSNWTSRMAFNGNALLITGRRHRLIGEFERRLPIGGGRWALFLPHEPDGTPPFLERLYGDVELHYMFADVGSEKLESRLGGRNFPIGDIVKAISEERYALAKLDLYGDVETEATSDGGENSFRQLAQLLPRLNTRQLLVTIRLVGGVSDNTSTALLIGWYRTVYYILTREHYALLGAHSGGGCDAAQLASPVTRQRFTCEYRVTFLRVEDTAERFAYDGDVPTFGLGSPLEEKYRLERYLGGDARRDPLWKHRLNNNPDDEDRCVELPPPSKSAVAPMMPCRRRAASSTSDNFNRFTNALARQCNALVVAVDVPSVVESADAQRSLNALCGRVVLWCPRRLTANVSSPATVQWIGAGLLADAQERRKSGMNGTRWPLEQLVRQSALRPHESNILLVDLAGAEWSGGSMTEDGSASTRLLGGLLMAGKLCEPEIIRHFEQIVIRIRMWTIEEASNYRRMYRHLLRFVECGGFRKALSRRVGPSTWQLWFERRLIVHF